VFFSSSANVQIGVHPRLDDAQGPEPVELRGMGIEIEGAGDQHVEAGFVGLARRGGQVGARHGAVFRADQDRGAAHLVAFLEAALGADPLTGPRRHAVEIDLAALVGLVNAGAFQIVDDDLREIDLRRAGTTAAW
jgi:hypothetical protein